MRHYAPRLSRSETHFVHEYFLHGWRYWLMRLAPYKYGLSYGRLGNTGGPGRRPISRCDFRSGGHAELIHGGIGRGGKRNCRI